LLGYVYGHDQAVAKFVAQLIPHARDRGFGPNIIAIGIVNDGKLIAGVVYHNYDTYAGVMELSGAALPGSRWVTPETIRRCYQYPFLQCRCQMIVQRVAADDARQLRQLSALDYAFTPLPRMLGRDRDGIICTLTFEAWAANKFCRRFGHHIAQPAKEEAA
jgi:hypothetical protein